MVRINFCSTAIHASIFYTSFFLFRVMGSFGVYPTWGTPLDRSPVHCKQLDKITLTPVVNLESALSLACMLLDCGSKAEYPEKIHVSAEKTWKHGTERPQSGLKLASFLFRGNSGDRIRFPYMLIVLLMKQKIKFI